ncbi:holin [Salmonella enterica subsp. enterica serovar Heidelberg]|nr:holin [Salmonella enterica subsp. enterica serovar Heidelberg]
MADSELVSGGMKLAPSALVSGGYFLGISWDNWVLIATFIYTVLQIGDWFYSKYSLWKEKKRGKTQ